MSPKLDIVFRACPRKCYQMAFRLADPASEQSYEMSMNGFRLGTHKTGGHGPETPVFAIEKV